MKKIIFIACLGVLVFTIGCTQYDFENEPGSLMQNETTGEYNCFGCVQDLLGSTFCGDPGPGWEPVQETSDRYCQGLTLVEK